MLARLSLRARLLLGVVLLTALGLVAADVATYGSLRSFLLHRVDTGLEAGHKAFEHPPPNGQRPEEDAGDHQGPPPEGVDWYEVRTLAGHTLRHESFVEGLLPPKLPAKIALPTRPDRRDKEGDELVRYFDAPARKGDGSYRVRASVESDRPHQMLLVASSLGGIDSTLHRLLLIELIATAAVLAALAALAHWVVRLGLRPLRAIEATASAITAGDLSHRVDHPDARTEVGRVGSALNEMLDRIETSDRRLRRFVADASHELRTPLAAVRAYAELFGRGAAARPEDLERSMSGIRREAERMSLLVDDLLLLARLDEGRPLEREPVDLAKVVQEAVDAARVVEPGRPIELSAEPATVTGDETRLRQVLDNLLANARTHTPAGTPVSVELRRADGLATVTVADHGPGLEEEQAARVFERFYRADSSRARSSGGAGLGLSIVAAVTEAHEGTVETKPTPGGGTTFVLALPLGAG
ncbi:MAG TPA: HAMP domain-containing sensor histidine kinase [Gaiellaceae bacterium]|nr:HAMP domain-containing sensor histidine kinase [Gaiellaceae bacterium]